MILLNNFKNIYLCIMSYVSFERHIFVLYDGALTLKISKMALNPFCDETLHIVGWEPEGRYCHKHCTAIEPFWFSTETLHMVIELLSIFFVSKWHWIKTNHNLLFLYVLYACFHNCKYLAYHCIQWIHVIIFTDSCKYDYIHENMLLINSNSYQNLGKSSLFDRVINTGTAGDVRRCTW